MIGTSVVLRVRMSAHDAHYAGELVDGARIMSLFGDLATELLIRLDGDEGLFRAYESVDFLAPVYAGDFVEATAVLLAVGNTSRKIRFEARKVISNVRPAWASAGPLASPPASSAADVLSEPVVVARAVGTCVVPRAMQRRMRELPMPGLPAGPGRSAPAIEASPDAIEASPAGDEAPELIVTAAIVGAELTRAQTPYLPLTPDEIADEAARCCAAGATVIHLHVRRDDGTNTQAADRFATVIDAIRSRCDCIIQTSTGGAVGMTLEERLGPLHCRPEMATLNCGTLNFGDDVFINSRRDIRAVAARIREAGAIPELECYEIGHIEEALSLLAEGAIHPPLHFQFVLGVRGAIPAREDVVQFMRALLPPGATWGVAAVGKWQQPMTELSIRLGGHARVGIEDNIFLSKGVLAEGSAPLVARAVAYAQSIGRRVATLTSARSALGLSLQ